MPLDGETEVPILQDIARVLGINEDSVWGQTEVPLLKQIRGALVTLIDEMGSGGVTTFAALTDAGTADIPAINTPTATALGLKAIKIANTFTGIQTIAPTTPGSCLVLTSGTVTTSLPFLTATQTLNDGAVTFIGARLTFTDTASAAGSLLFQILGASTGATNVFSVGKTGRLTFGSTAAAPTTATSDGNTMAWSPGGNGSADLISNVGSYNFQVIGGNVLQIAGGDFIVLSPRLILNNSSTGHTVSLVSKSGQNTLQLGIDAAGVSNQLFTAANRTGSDGVGADLQIAAGNGRGGAGGTLILSTFTTGAAATVGVLTPRMTIDTAGAIAFPNVTAVVTETVVSDRTLAVTINGVAYKICLKV